MNHQVFFYCHHCGSPQESAFQHWTLCLAEGFKSLGIPFYSDKNYWQSSPDQEQYLFAYNPEVKRFFRTYYAKLPQTKSQILAEQGFGASFRVNLDG